MSFYGEMVGFLHGVKFDFDMKFGRNEKKNFTGVRSVNPFDYDVEYSIKALNIGCDVGDHVDVAKVEPFLRKNNMTPETADIEVIKKQFPEFDTDKITDILGTISVITFVENHGMNLSEPNTQLVSISDYISDLEPGSILPSAEEISKTTGADIGLVYQYIGILSDFNAMARTLKKPFTIGIKENPQQIPVQQQNQKANRKSTKNQQPAAAQ